MWEKLGRARQPPQRRPMNLACHQLETIWQETTTRETSQAVERRPGQILERHDLAEDSTKQANLETACWGLPPTTGHYGYPTWWFVVESLWPVFVHDIGFTDNRSPTHVSTTNLTVSSLWLATVTCTVPRDRRWMWSSMRLATRS